MPFQRRLDPIRFSKFVTMSASASLEAEKDSSRPVSASDMSNVETVAVPTVEVKHAPFQSQPTLRGEVTEEQMKELGERMRTEQAKKYFSLRVRTS